MQHTVGNVPLGTKWSYVIGLSGNTISLVIDGGATQTFAMSSTFDQEGMYFKAGDYDQSVGTQRDGRRQGPVLRARDRPRALTGPEGGGRTKRLRC